MITRLLENINIVTAFAPSDINTDADGDWVSLKNYEGCLVVFHKEAGTAGDDPSIKLQQASDVSATGAKALTFDHIYHKIGATALSGVGTFTKVELTSATDDLDLVSVNSVDLATDINESLIVVDVKAADLDVQNGFDCLQLSIEGDDVGNATKAAAFYLLYGPRYAGASPLTAIAD
jgi:hypothetical protein